MYSAGTPLGVLQDSSSGTITLWSAEALHEVTMTNEGQDMWRIYLEHQVRGSQLLSARCTAQLLPAALLDHCTTSILCHSEAIK
jgi:hypothetical protein